MSRSMEFIPTSRCPTSGGTSAPYKNKSAHPQHERFVVDAQTPVRTSSSMSVRPQHRIQLSPRICPLMSCFPCRKVCNYQDGISLQRHRRRPPCRAANGQNRQVTRRRAIRGIFNDIIHARSGDVNSISTGRCNQLPFRAICGKLAGIRPVCRRWSEICRDCLEGYLCLLR